MEPLEQRLLLSISPTLVSITSNEGDTITNSATLHVAPRELTIRFDAGQVINAATLSTGIRITRAGQDGLFGQANDVVVQPGAMLLASDPRDVIVRFAANLPDDLYRIDLIGAGATPLRNQQGNPFNNGVNVSTDFRLDLGPQVVSVVPQPVTRNPATGQLTQAKDQVVVYFNTDRLDPVAAQNPAFYRLTDAQTGQVLLPSTAVYTAAENKVVLTFASNLPDTTFDLQIGVSDEPNDTLATAVNVGTIAHNVPSKTYDSPILEDAQGNQVPLPIADNDTTISRIVVGDTFLVQDVNVQLDLDHTRGPDLRIFLVGPNGARVELARDLASAPATLTGTVLDDEASTSISAGVSPYTGRFRPIEPLTAFDGSSAQGSWQLEIQDTATGNTGVLRGWRLILNQTDQQPPDFRTTAFVGDRLAKGANDVDLYRINVLEPGVLSLHVVPSATLDSVVRVFDAAGAPLGVANTAGLGASDDLALTLPEAGTYFVGVSSSANVSYSPVDGSNANGGASTGQYVLEASFDKAFDFNDNNSTYAQATNLGTLGTGDRSITAEISGGLPPQSMPGSNAEPGHRDIPAETHLNASGGDGLSFVANQVLMKFSDGVAQAQRDALLAANGLQVVKSFASGALLLTSNGGDVLAKIDALKSNTDVQYASPNYLEQATGVFPNDPKFPEMWGLNNIGQTGGVADSDVDAPEAWQRTVGSPNVVVAVIDTGVDYTHPDLAANMWRNPGEIPGDGIDNDNNGYVDDVYGIDAVNNDSDPMDDVDHGTHVSGTIAAVGNNGVGVVGVDWQAQIMALKFLGKFGGSDADAIEAIEYMTMMKTQYGVNIVASNNSWGGGGFDPALQEVIQRSINAGILFVAAAGNGGSDGIGDDNDSIANYPSGYGLQGIISVAATDDTDTLGDFSNFGRTTVDLAAPGVDIVSTVPGNNYGAKSGTSMATPHVTGAVALLASLDASATPMEIKNAILASVDPVSTLNGKVLTGGRLNIARAEEMLGSSAPVGNATLTAYYNFQDVYGVLPSGDIAHNVITENQKQRGREIFELIGSQLGIQFIETANQGLTVVTGDLRAIDPTVPTGPGGVAGISEGSLGARVIMDAAENWGNSEYAGGWFQVAMHEIGHSLGLGHTYDLPPVTVMGSDPGQAPNGAEPVFPGKADIIHGQLLLPPAADDIDLYRFELSEPGVVTAEIAAERLAKGASLLDAALTLYRETLVNGVPRREVVATNDDYFSSDPYLNLRLDAGVYYVAVTSSGNREFDPSIADSGFGGRSEGRYELRLDLQASPHASIVDTTLTPLDGDADGRAGGQFDFWFQSGETIFVDKLADVTAGPDGNGSLAQPYDTIAAALRDAGTRIVVPAAGGAAIGDGESFTLVDLANKTATFEFDLNGTVAGGHVAVPTSASASQAAVAAAIAAAINGAAGLTASASVAGRVVRVGGVQRLDVSGSAALLETPNLVRIVANGGTDGNVATIGNNRPYLIGVDNLGQTLPDGANFRVPQGTTVMIDAGALVKLQKAIVDVGTSAVGVDRRGGALQVLGTPQAAVFFRSFRDDSAGGDSDGVSAGPRPGDWGGLVFRDDSDREQQDIYLNVVNYADMLSGGGKVTVESVEERFAPIHLVGARPALTHNVIRQSADAAISADLNSFDDSQGRIGPDIHDNLILDNSINGLFVRIRTQLGQPIDRLTVPGRFDDTDIVHVLSENLVIAGTPGGPTVDAATGNLTARLDGRLAIDPGVIVKLQGARIEAEMGAQLIAEGTAAHPVIFTSQKDDTYGGSGSFDTTNDGAATSPQPGQWGGLFFNPVSKGSLDHATIAYAGGLTPIEGGFDKFAAVEIHQGDVRIANSVFASNSDGQSTSDRNGRGNNVAAAVFVRGAQPVIVDNVFRGNVGNAISIDANSLDATIRPDYGRSTGPIDRFAQFDDNYGPLVRLNRLTNNSTNGMEVRGATLTTESVWDDTDIAHVLRSEIVLFNQHALSGLRLQSSASESLVVKLSGPSAGFTADGVLLDINDRIGGSLYVLGQPGHPVYLTSLADDSVTAGFDANGRPLGDTNNDGDSATSGSAQKPQPGDWRSVKLGPYSNDRNVEVLREFEGAFIGANDLNDLPAKAQFLGVLAPDEKSGDTDRPLGFEVHGAIALDDPADVDVYSFDGRVGTEVWIDIDRTSAALDSVVELIGSDGAVIARSLDDESLSGSALTVTKDAWRGGDFYSVNPRDAGMRVVLPGNTGDVNKYYVRVRSQPVGGDEADTSGGQSRGEYQLQIRLRQVDEKPGSTVSYANISYATNGIEVLGLPGHSPLVGEAGESSDPNDSLPLAQPIGNLLTSDRNTISVSGNLSTAADVDWYRFTLNYDLIQAIGGFSNADKTWSTIFDIDYADGLSRPDTTISVFDQDGNLVLVSRDSNIEDDQVGFTPGAASDLTRGSFGTLDAYIGSVQMPAGVIPAGTSRTYYVAISSNAALPEVLNATFQTGAANPLIRLEPVNSVKRIVEDHIGFSGHSTGSPLGAGVPVPPVQPLFDITNTTVPLTTYVTPFTLSDVVLYVSAGGGLKTVNPFTGGGETDLGSLPVSDIAMRADGRLFGVRGLDRVGNTAGELVEADWANGGFSSVGQDNIPDFDPQAMPAPPNQLTTDNIDALAYDLSINGQNQPVYKLYYSVRGSRPQPPVPGAGSTLYVANSDTGDASTETATVRSFRGAIYANTKGDVGITTGMAIVGGQLFGVSDTGIFYQIATSNGRASNVVDMTAAGITSFAGLAPGPPDLQGGAYANLLFATDTDGNLYALDTNGQLQAIFAGGATSVSTGLGGATGLAFSPLDFNLWHPTMTRKDDSGHGVNPSFDQSRNFSKDFPVSLNGRGSNEASGGASFRFGLDTWQKDPKDFYFTYAASPTSPAPDAQFGILSTATHNALSSNPNIANTYNLPGGALGSLSTNAFSLQDYVPADKPTLYFNYFLSTQDANSNSDKMRDSFRVLASPDGGTTWQLLATNNSILSTLVKTAELPQFISASANASFDFNQGVQELFDNTGGWRQARVDLAPLAGASDIQLRFDFSTAGTMNQGVPGDAFGDFFSKERAQQNGFEGAYIDDVLIGFAERGEMVTTSPNQPNPASFFAVPRSPDPSAPSQVLAGPYQLEMRRGTEYGVNISGLTSDIVVGRQFDTNDRMIEPLGRLGDQNAQRDQGIVRIDANTVRFASEFGIVVDAGTRDPVGDISHPGAVQNLPTLNNRRLVPGVSVANNVIANLGFGGIAFSGDASPTGPVAAVPYGQIINNTIFGDSKATGVGIAVNENANPTILNNVVVNTEFGIFIDASSSQSVVGANLFKGNTSNGTVGQNPLLLPAAAALFLNAAQGNFYLAQGSLAIDSALNNLPEDPSLLAVKGPLGIPTAPILAPDRDRFGQLRIDDPSQPSLPGLGSNVFKDRGAVERADFAGPQARLLNPVDNDAGGVDQDPAANSIVVTGQPFADFQIQLVDGTGAGIDDATVSRARFTLLKNGSPLVEGVDYAFVYDPTNNVARFTPSNGTWPANGVYRITVDNSTATGIKDLAGNALQPNEPTGQTQFTISLLPIDFGDAPDGPYATLIGSNGARHVLSGGLFLGAGVSSEPNGQPSINADADTLDDGVAFNTPLVPGTTATITVTASQAGKLDAWIDLGGNGSWADAGDQIFASQALMAGANVLTFLMPATTVTSTFARFRVSTAGGLAPTGLATDGEVEDYRVDLPPVVSYTVVLVNATTGKELLKDADGNYVVLGGGTFRAQVYVDDLRNAGAAGGVFSAFADLTRDSSFITWSGLAISASFPNGQNGTIVGQQIVDEAGGVGNISPAGADPKQLLFTVDGTVDLAAPLGTHMTLSLDAADVPLAHDTLVYGLSAPVSATYGAARLAVPVNAWHNPVNGMDVDGDGDVTPLDALFVINKLNAHFGGPNGELPAPPQPPTLPPPYLDVFADSFFTPLDALVIINFLNTQALAQLGGGGASVAAAQPHEAPLLVDAAPPQSPVTTAGAEARSALEVASIGQDMASTSLLAASLELLDPAADALTVSSAAPSSSSTESPAATNAKDALFAGRDDASAPWSARWADELPWMQTAAMQTSVAAQAAGQAARKPVYARGAHGAFEPGSPAGDAVAVRLFARHWEDASAMDLADIDPRLADGWSNVARLGSRPGARRM